MNPKDLSYYPVLDKDMDDNIQSILKDSPPIIEELNSLKYSTTSREKKLIHFMESFLLVIGIQDKKIKELTQFIDENF